MKRKAQRLSTQSKVIITTLFAVRGGWHIQKRDPAAVLMMDYEGA